MTNYYSPYRERRANSLYRLYIALTKAHQAQIATAILLGGPKGAAELYGVSHVRAVLHYHPAIKHRGITYA
jgi:hypothetical protein